MLYISLYYYITSRVTLIHVSTPSFFLIRSVFSLSPASHVVTSIFIPTYTYKGVYSKKGEGVNTNTNTTCTTRTRTNLWTVIPRIHSPTTPTMMLAVSQHRSICSTFVQELSRKTIAHYNRKRTTLFRHSFIIMHRSCQIFPQGGQDKGDHDYDYDHDDKEKRERLQMHLSSICVLLIIVMYNVCVLFLPDPAR